MFGKLMKYEWKDCMRVFLPLWGAILALAAMNGVTIGVDLKIRNGWLEFFVHILPVLLLFALSFGMFVVAFVLIIRRFYNGLLGEGGYLAFSLPVTVGEHIAAKLLTALIMNIGCVLAGLLSSVLLLSIRGYLPEMKELLQAISRELSSYRHTGLVITEGILLMILLCTYSTLRLYAGMAIGHLFSNHRGLWSIAAVILMGWIFTYAAGRTASLCLPYLQNHHPDFLFTTLTQFLDRLPLYLGFSIVLALLGNALLWGITHGILRKKLNIL